MKRTSDAKPKATELRPEYAFDYTKAKPNRFAGKVRSKSVVVLLDPDVSTVFKDGESVNTVLRTLIGAMPKTARH
jgi:hypothetical protein